MNKLHKMIIEKNLKEMTNIKDMFECPHISTVGEKCRVLELLDRLNSHDYLYDEEKNKFIFSREDIFFRTDIVYDILKDEEYRVFTCCKSCLREIEGINIFYCDYHERYEIGELVFVEGDRMCEKLEGMVFEYCAECGKPVYTSQITDKENKVCKNCDKNISKIHRYHSFKDLKFLGNPSDNVFYGMEIETSYDSDEEYGIIIPKNDIVDNISHYEEDSSITGVECVTQPMSYEFAMNNIHHILNHLKDNGFYIEEDNGLHIHITRTEKTEKLLPKVLYLLENNKNDIITFSGRESYELEDWASFYISDNYVSLDECIDVLNGGYGRYHIINNTNENTIEFRLFRSSLRVELVLGALEFIAILFELAEIIEEAEEEGISIHSFINLFDNLKEYAEEYGYHNFLYRCWYYEV